MIHAFPTIPLKNELQKYLGSPYQLDGSLSSLWTVEIILHTLRKKKKWADRNQWIVDYVLHVVTRCYDECEIPFSLENGIFQTKNYKQNIQQDILNKLMIPHDTIDLHSEQTWNGAIITGLGSLPFYVDSVLRQNNAWGSKSEPLSSELNDRILNWMTVDLMKSEIGEDTTVESHPTAYKVIKSMIETPIYEIQNRKAEANINALRDIFKSQSTMDAFVDTILLLLSSQNRLLQLLAGGACFLINIAPTSSEHARILHKAESFFSPLPATISGDEHERVIEVIRMLLTSTEPAMEGSTNPKFLNCITLANQNKLEEACEELTQLIESDPKALYYRSRGRLLERLGHKRYALDDYNQAIQLEPNYWQALVNRAAYQAKQKEFHPALVDYLRALEIRPYNEVTRDNLLTVFFLEQFTS